MPNSLPATFGAAISRGRRHIDSLSITTSEGTTSVIDMRGAASMALYIPTGSSCTSLTLYGRVGGTSTYVAIRDTTGTAVTQTVASNAVNVIKDEIYPFEYIKLVGNAEALLCVAMLAT